MKLSSWDNRNFDVIVCGAGSAGCAAAYGAARAGARTLLVERLGFAGGTPVSAAIHTLDAVHSCRDYSLAVVGGYVTALVEELRRMGGMGTPDNPPEALVVHPELMKVAIDRVLTRAGVVLLYQAHIVDAICRNGEVIGIEAAVPDGRARFEAPVTIDATGDAAIAFFANADWTQHTELQAITYHFRLGNVRPGSTWHDLENQCRGAMEARAPAGLSFGGPWVIRLTEGEVSINATRVSGNPLAPGDRSRMEQRAREDMLQIADILRREVPALSGSYILSGATDLHVRESRKILGDYVLTEEDVLGGAHFPDTIAIGAWPIDIHPSGGAVGVHPHKDNPPEPYEIPYRCLLPKGVERLLVPGKAVSSTHGAHGSTRVPGTSMATGHAAGVAAALACRSGHTPRQVDPEEIRRELLRQGAILSAAGQMVE